MKTKEIIAIVKTERPLIYDIEDLTVKTLEKYKGVLQKELDSSNQHTPEYIRLMQGMVMDINDELKYREEEKAKRDSKITHRVSLKKIKETGYELYKLDWMDNNITTKELRDMYKEYDAFVQKCVEKKIKNYPDFDKYINQMGGFGAENKKYSLYEDFLKNEFLDGDYMCQLFEEEPELYDGYVGNNTIRLKIHYANEMKSEDMDEEIERQKSKQKYRGSSAGNSYSVAKGDEDFCMDGLDYGFDRY